LNGPPRTRRSGSTRARLDDAARFVAVQNMTLVFRAAQVALSADADLSPAAVDARAQLLAALGKMR
jgi:hypothetical protein